MNSTRYQPCRLLITGGCGFIGSNFIRWLLQSKAAWPATDGESQDFHILNFDKLTYAGNPENLQDLESHPRYQFVQGDLCQREQLESLFLKEQIDTVLHFAAESHVDRSILDSSPFVQTNVVGTQNLLDVSRKFQVQRFLQVSTDEVYGTLGAEGAFTEETPLAPNSPYSASKAAADLLVRSYFQTFEFPALITRCSNNYGPYQFPEKLIPLFLTNALKDQPLPVYGDGLQIRDWIHVLDHCRGIWAALTCGQVGEVYNFGGRCELTNLALIEQLLEELNKPRSLITFVKDRPGHDRRYAIDCSKAERELNWQPTIAFRDGLRETVAWYSTHKAWVDRIRSGEYRDYYSLQYGTSDA